MKSIAVKSVHSIRRTNPYVWVFLLIYTVDCSCQAFFLWYSSEHELLFGENACAEKQCYCRKCQLFENAEIKVSDMFFHKCQHRSSQRYENRTIIFKNVYFIFKKCLQTEEVDKIEKYKVKIISALMRYACIFAATNENWMSWNGQKSLYGCWCW